MMDKKPLIGVSICAVVLLVLGSLSNVVGYQSVKSTAVNDSPLFQTRTQRATNQQQNILTSQYLGKGINALSFPLRDTTTEMIQKFIDKIRTMDDESFNHFIIIVLYQIRQRNLFNDINPQETVIVLNQIKNNPNLIRNYINQKANDITFVAPTCYGLTIRNWLPGCISLTIIGLIFAGIIFFLGVLLNFFVPTYNIACWSHKSLCLVGNNQ
jgi:hypothetical protein